jgi:predicted Zn-dependent protease
MVRRYGLVVIAAAAMACVTNPATGRSQLNLLSEAQEIALGRESDQQIRAEMGVYDDAGWQAYVSRVGLAMAKKSHRPNLPWSFVIVDASAVNAFALPGGFIYLTRGILPFLQNEAELANVLGHEIAHVTALHGASAYSKQQLTGLGLGIGRILAPERYGGVFGGLEVALSLAFLKHGRDAEREADRLGVGYASSSGWDPAGMVGLLSTLGRLAEASGSSRGVPNFLTTHPLPEDRIAAVRDLVTAAQGPGAQTVNAAEFSGRLPGVVWGDSREQGIVRGREFAHPILRIALRFPDGWEISNGASQVTAQPAGEAQAAVVLRVVPNASGGPAQAARTQMAAAKLTEVSGGDTTINGLRAYVGTYRGEQEVVRAAFIAAGSTTYLVAGVATSQAFSSVQGTFANTIESFRTMTQTEADRIQPFRVGQYTVRSGDTWTSIASSASQRPIGPATLAIMNGATPASTPPVGARIRVVVGG